VTTYDRVLTPRLELRAVTPEDLPDVHELHADPRLWEHLPSGRHTDLAVTADMVDRIVQDWAYSGLGYWAARPRVDLPGGPVAGSFVGVAGVKPIARMRWNLYYRLASQAQGHGLAGETVTAALDAAADADPSLPVVAYMLEHNVASWRIAERAGLQLLWRGPDRGNPDPAAIRLIYADRPAPPEALADLT
jgi:RimJ/RimL family protein N-acetyltransferase